MNSYLLDTNILLRIADTSSSQHTLVVTAIINILMKGDKCVIASQVLIEFWVVATRPVEVNGLGWTTQFTTEKMRQFILQFLFIEETKDIFTNWYQLVTTYKVKGKRTHDIRLLAVMTVYQIPYLLTLNPKDFLPLPNITIIRPQDLLIN